jgi:hypothetical protein
VRISSSRLLVLRGASLSREPAPVAWPGMEPTDVIGVLSVGTDRKGTPVVHVCHARGCFRIDRVHRHRLFEVAMVRRSLWTCHAPPRIDHDRLHASRPVRTFEGVRRRSEAFCTFCDPGAANTGMDNVNHEGAPRCKSPDAPQTRLSGPVAWTRWVAHWEKGSIGAGFLPARKARSS